MTSRREPVAQVGREVEAWFADALGRAVARRRPELDVRLVAVDLAGKPKLGEFRAHFEAPPEMDESAWAELAAALAEEPEVDSAVARPPRIHFSPSTAAFVAAAAERAGRGRLVTTEDTAEPGIIVVFCSPNANKPLHLGHLRACFLGTSLSRLFEATGTPALRSQMLSNFGTHICKALAMHERDPVDPASKGMKADWYVGDLYRQYHEVIGDGGAEDCAAEGHLPDFNGSSCLRCRPQELLMAQLHGDPQALAENELLTEWSTEAIAVTQRRVGVEYDFVSRELDSIPLALDAVNEGADNGACVRRPDGSVYMEIQETGSTELTLVRSDGTPLAFTMMLGVHFARADQYPGWRYMELTGEQWHSGRAALYEVFSRLGRGDVAERTENVWFGMVRQDGATMKSRAGTVVRGDALLDELCSRVAAWKDRPEVLDVEGDDADRVGVALVKWSILGVSRKSPVDFDEDGMWASATEGLGRVARALAWSEASGAAEPEGKAERALALMLTREGVVVDQAAFRRDPAILVRYVDELADWALDNPQAALVSGPMRAALGRVLRRDLHLLDIELPGQAWSADESSLAAAGSAL